MTKKTKREMYNEILALTVGVLVGAVLMPMLSLYQGLDTL